ncbi:hypothetical protein [Idiomarina aminovorans]|uniref:hypothetical protein n=1 Tax=Idiomarina aminovorans TaxID=2914829 RepID=UPI00200500DA|nr:hypothetical protein [Idiomarina sp. ATCH4]MCK7459946.1 hypothetical protein [Idiomarina sp. ATCH4]
MIDEILSDKVLKNLGELGYSKSDIPKTLAFSGTLKEILSNTHSDKEVKVIGKQLVEVTMHKSTYLTALLTDILFGAKRIENQSANIECLVDNSQQAAWVLVSTYYAAYFLACDLSKLCGSFITNISQEGIFQLLQQTTEGRPSLFQSSKNESFSVNVSTGTYQNEVTLQIRKTGAKPHKVAWSNLYSIINGLSFTDNQISLERLKDIIDSQNKNWKLPSTVRNEWNYSAIHYYGSKGSSLASVFYKLMKSKNSSFKLFRNNSLYPHEENVAASIAYVYDTLLASHKRVLNRIGCT